MPGMYGSYSCYQDGEHTETGTGLRSVDRGTEESRHSVLERPHKGQTPGAETRTIRKASVQRKGALYGVNSL